MFWNDNEKWGTAQLAEGRHSEIFYMDDEGNVCDKYVATRYVIRELEGDGNLIQETFGFVNSSER